MIGFIKFYSSNSLKLKKKNKKNRQLVKLLLKTNANHANYI